MPRKKAGGGKILQKNGRFNKVHKWLKKKTWTPLQGMKERMRTLVAQLQRECGLRESAARSFRKGKDEPGETPSPLKKS